MGLLKKALEKATPVKATPVAAKPSVNYPIEVRFWKDHRDGITDLLRALDFTVDDFGEWYTLRGKLVPEPDNEVDKNAIQVYAGPKGKRNWFYIGYIPSDDAPYIKPDIKKVVSGTHYWSIRMKFDVAYGLEFDLRLKESQFK